MNRQILSNIIQRALTDKSFRRRLSSDPQAVLADFDLSDGDIQLVQQALAAESSGPGTMQLEQRISRSRLPMGIFFGFLDDHAHSDEGSDELILNEDDHTQQTDESAQIAGERAEGEINFEKPDVRVEGTDGSRGPSGAPIHLPGGKANGDPSLPGGKYADGPGGESGPGFYHDDHGQPHVHYDSTPVYHYDDETGGGWVEEFDYGRAEREWDMWQMDWNDRYGNDEGEGASASNIQDFPESKVAGWNNDDDDDDPYDGYDDDDDDGDDGDDGDDDDGDDGDDGDGDSGDDGGGDDDDDDDDEEDDDEGGDDEGYGDDQGPGEGGYDGSGRGPGFGGMPGGGGNSGPLNGDGRDDNFGAPKGFGLPSGGGVTTTMMVRTTAAILASPKASVNPPAAAASLTPVTWTITRSAVQQVIRHWSQTTQP